MKKLFILTFLLLSSCQFSEKGNYRVVTENPDAEYQATQISVDDELNKIEFKDEKGVKHTHKGSFEVYEN